MLTISNIAKIIKNKGGHTKIQNNTTCSYLFDVSVKEHLDLYYGLKERTGYDLKNRDILVSEISGILRNHITLSGYDYVIYPESSSGFLEEILSLCKIRKYKITKNTKEDIVAKIDILKLQKKEKESHLKHIAEMDDTFKIRMLKINQRKKYHAYLFRNELLDLKGKGFILDDSCFSGTTFDALQLLYGKHDLFAIFAK